MIEVTSERVLDQVPNQETWSLDMRGKWRCFRGPRFSVPLLICDGRLDEVCADLQILRNGCEKQPHTPGYAVGWMPRQLADQGPVTLRREDGTVRFALLFVVTTGTRVLGETYRETLPHEAPIVEFEKAVKEWVEENP